MTKRLTRVLSEKFRDLFEITVEFVFAVIILFLGLGIVIGVVQMFAQLWALVAMQGVTGSYIDVITDVLTLYVLVELSRSLVEYFYSKRLKLTYILDAALVFVLREILIGLFKHSVETDMLYAMTGVILVLGILRTATQVVSAKAPAGDRE